MGGMKPFAEIIGPTEFYVAAAGTAIPNLDAAPNASWFKIGVTDGEQTWSVEGDLTYFYDNDGLGATSARRPQTDVFAAFTLIHMTQENLSRILNNVSALVDTTSGALTVREMPFDMDYVPTEYALLARGSTHSPYGLYPAQNYIPRGVFDQTVELTTGKDTRAEVECEFHALRDDSQVDPRKKMGWSQAQVS